MNWCRRFVEERLERGLLIHVLACGHERAAIVRTHDGEPDRWQYCPTCYAQRKGKPSPPPARDLAGEPT